MSLGRAIASGLALAAVAAVAGHAGTPAPAAAREKPRPGSMLELSRLFESLAEQIQPAVVQVFTTGFGAAGAGDVRSLGRQRGTGSGVVVDPQGYVLTNAHVVERARRVRVVLAAGREPEGSPGRSILKPRGRSVAAAIAGIDRESDVALLKLDLAPGSDPLAALEFGDSDRLRQGQIVFAFGSPLGLDNSMTMGVVSAVARQVQPEDAMVYIQTDASINPGNSGGPLVDGDGRLVGLNTFILSQSGGNEGIGFAVPSNIVANVYRQLRRDGRVRRGTIGVEAQTLTPALARGLGLARDWGVILSDVAPDSPAAAAGLRTGDLVLALGGKPMENARQLEVNLYRHQAGEVVRLEVLRGGEASSLPVTVAERPEHGHRFAERVDPVRDLVPELGVLALTVDAETRAALPPLRLDDGVLVASPGPSGDGSLLPGDVIHSLNGGHVADVAALRRVLAGLAADVPIVLQVERGRTLRFVTVERD